jgi:RNA recognition motif-containing protein
MNTKPHVGNLQTLTTEEALLVKFREFGQVEAVEIIRNQRTGQSIGFGFVEMSSRAEADLAINRLNSTVYGDRTMSVSMAQAKQSV